MNPLAAAFPLALLIAVVPALAQAQTAPAKPAAKAAPKAAPKADAKPAAKAAAKADTKPAAKADTKAVTAGTTPRQRAAQKAAEEARPIDDNPAVKLSENDLAVAKQVITGDIPCELGATVHITPDKREGFFIVRAGIQRFRMHPVDSRTGAIRLEDPVGGAMWLQLGNKSMLMSQKMGKRLADDCMNPTQSAMNESLKKNPINILEAAPVKVVAPATESPAAVAGTAASPPGTPPVAPAANGAPVTAPASTEVPAGTAPASSSAPPAPTSR